MSMEMMDRTRWYTISDWQVGSRVGGALAVLAILRSIMHVRHRAGSSRAVPRHQQTQRLPQDTRLDLALGMYNNLDL